MEINLPVIAGGISTTIFALSTLPMLLKVARTKDLKSYSLGNILLSNLGNVVHSVYIFNLPAGPIWLLHAFYLVTTGLMLVWFLRYEWCPGLRFSGFWAYTRRLIHVNRRPANTPSKYPAWGMPPRGKCLTLVSSRSVKGVLNRGTVE